LNELNTLIDNINTDSVTPDQVNGIVNDLGNVLLNAASFTFGQNQRRKKTFPRSLTMPFTWSGVTESVLILSMRVFNSFNTTLLLSFILTDFEVLPFNPMFSDVHNQIHFSLYFSHNKSNTQDSVNKNNNYAGWNSNKADDFTVFDDAYFFRAL
jgi:hypothetical protein